MSRLAWTDPAPLEVERPSLPWWTPLPRKLLLATDADLDELCGYIAAGRHDAPRPLSGIEAA